MNVNPFRRKSRVKKLLESLDSNDALKSAAITAAESAVAGATSRRQAEKLSDALGIRDSGGSSSSFKTKAKSGLVLAAGTAAVIATSASISSLRRREKAS